MVNPTLTYDNEYNRRLADILANYDDIQASSNPPTMVVGGIRQKKYINSGNTPYDGREGTAHFSGAMYGGSCGSARSGGLNPMALAMSAHSAYKAIPAPYRHQIEQKAIHHGKALGQKILKKLGGASSGGSHMKKAKAWRGFAVDTAHMGIDLFKHGKNALGGRTSGGRTSGGINHLKKATKWRNYAVDTAKMGIDLFKHGKNALGGRTSGGRHNHQMIQDMSFLPKPKTARATGYGRPANPWIQHVKAYQAQHGCSYKEAMKLAKHSYR